MTRGKPLLRHRAAIAVVVGVGAFGAAPAWAWNAAGHRLSVAVAWPSLSPAVREEIDRILDAHPDAERWRTRIRQPWPGALLGEASTWPDELRRAARERSAKKETAPGDEHVHRDWHYLDWPIGAAMKDARGGQLDRQIARLSATVADRGVAPSQRAEALAWLVHLVGDAHMPLHVATWRDSEGSWTAGGNGVEMNDPQNPRLPQTNLHRFWDDLPGPPWLHGTRLLAAAESLRAKYPAPVDDAVSPPGWIAESHALAAEILRRPAEKQWTVTADERRRAEGTAERQVARAGQRLARLLEALLGR